MPEVEASGIHLHVPPHAGPTGLGPEFDGVVHWTTPLAPASPHALVDATEDVLEHVARCLDREAALVVWESALRTERLSVEAVRRIRWMSRAAAELAQRVTGLSDSGLETIFVVRLSSWGLPIRQQIVIAGHRVDVLIGDRLIVQLDGFAFHSTAAQRARDAAHDAELALRGYVVLRFTYAQVIHDWPAVERTVVRALAAGAHRR
ncbi:endonuclease domain-containing protein [Microbacterium sp. HJ5]